MPNADMDESDRVVYDWLFSMAMLTGGTLAFALARDFLRRLEHMQLAPTSPDFNQDKFEESGDEDFGIGYIPDYDRAELRHRHDPENNQWSFFHMSPRYG